MMQPIFPARLTPVGEDIEALILRDEWINLYQIWRKHSQSSALLKHVFIFIIIHVYFRLQSIEH